MVALAAVLVTMPIGGRCRAVGRQDEINRAAGVPRDRAQRQQQGIGRGRVRQYHRRAACVDRGAAEGLAVRVIVETDELQFSAAKNQRRFRRKNVRRRGRARTKNRAPAFRPRVSLSQCKRWCHTDSTHPNPF